MLNRAPRRAEAGRDPGAATSTARRGPRCDLTIGQSQAGNNPH